jgi:hypothetical protein
MKSTSKKGVDGGGRVAYNLVREARMNGHAIESVVHPRHNASARNRIRTDAAISEERRMLEIARADPHNHPPSVGVVLVKDGVVTEEGKRRGIKL